MKLSRIIGVVVLAVIYVWLAWYILAAGGVNLKNIFVVAVAGIIIFVPLWKKYFRKAE